MEVKVYNIDTCDIYVTQKILKNKWIPIVLHALEGGNKSFNQLLACICYISNTQLSLTLNKLKFDAIITLCNGIYELTVKGQELYEVTIHMQKWSNKYQSKINN